MPINDQREPAVYVSIEDKSYIGPTTETGRVVYGAILTDRGPHNRIVEVTSQSQYQKLFSTPNIQRCSQTHYILDKALEFTGKILACRVVPSDSYLSNLKIEASTATTLVTGSFDFSTSQFDADGVEYDSLDPDHYIGNFTFGQITCDLADLDELTVGDWVFSTSDTSSEARQIISLTEAASAGIITLDQPYEGTAGINTLNIFTPYNTSSEAGILSSADIDPTDTFVYHFYANGAGAYYNDITVKCVRNFEMERMYTDEDGTPFYPYVFVDFYVYYNNENGTQTLLEGPWTVSLIRKTPNGEIIRDINTASAIYIEDVVNTNSSYVRVVSGTGVDALSDSVTGEEKRLQLMLLLMRDNPVGMDNIAGGGVELAEGTDGTGLFDGSGNISPNEALLGRVASAYSGSLTSVDGSVEMIGEYIYPRYEPDYIVSGGFPANVAYAAAQLASSRSDCMHLADTGSNYNNYLLDLQARQQTVAWNYWTSSLYIQYRQIRDNYTGRQFWMTPVYHAIQAHLYTDNTYFIAEPPCNVEKGAIGEEIRLAYQTNHTIRGDLQDKELNYTIAETGGVYFATQFTTWKRYSALKRQHIAKFTAYLHRNIPKILKDVIQRRASQYWLSQAHFIMNNFFLKFLDGSATDRYATISSYSVNLDFDKTRSELNVYVTFAPILSIERINVFLTIPTEL